MRPANPPQPYACPGCAAARFGLPARPRCAAVQSRLPARPRWAVARELASPILAGRSRSYDAAAFWYGLAAGT